MGSRAKHVVIVGAGVIGLATAYYAQQRGMRVTVLDRGEWGEEGCSHGNAGMVVPSHFTPLAAPGMVSLGLKWMWNPESPFYVRPRLSWELLAWGYRFWRAASRQRVLAAAPVLRDLHLASRAEYEKLAEALPVSFGLVRKGLLMLCKTREALEEESHAAEQARKLGVPAEVFDSAGLAALDPSITLDVRGGVHYPKDCHLAPHAFVEGLRSRVEQGGGEIRWRQSLLGWRVAASAIQAVRTSSGDVLGDEYVLAAGAWSQEASRELGLVIPMQAGKGYSLTLERPVELPQICSILTEARVAVTPLGDKLRVGGTMELSGLDDSIDRRRVQGIVKAIPRYFPRFKEQDFSGIAPWRGLRPCAPDGMPYLGRTRRYSNLIVATGHAMMGLSLAPITGKLVSELLAGETSAIDLRLLCPDRFA